MISQVASLCVVHCCFAPLFINNFDVVKQPYCYDLWRTNFKI